MNRVNPSCTMTISSTSRPRSRRIAWSLFLISLFATLWLASCKKGGAEAKPADVDYYTCSMHPSVRKQSPKDKCPICSMDLTPVKKKSSAATDAHAAHAGHGGQPTPGPTETAASEDKPGEFTVAPERQQQIGVTYAAIEKRSF